MFKRLREEWLYWRYRNITRRWLLLKSRLRARRRPSMGAAFRARGTAMYMPTRSTSGRGLLFVAIAAAVTAAINVLLNLGVGINWIDVIVLAVLAYVYVRYMGL